MNEPAKFNNVVSFLWAIADLLNGAFQKSEFQKIILPFTVLRRLDYALEKTKAKVLETERKFKELGLVNRHGQLCRAAGHGLRLLQHLQVQLREPAARRCPSASGSL